MIDPFAEVVAREGLLIQDGLLKVGVASAFDSIEHESLGASTVRVIFVAVGHEDDIDGALLHIFGTQEFSPIFEETGDRL